MSNTEWFVINNIEDFINKIRNIVYSNFGAWENFDQDIIIADLSSNDIEDLEKVLSYNECMIIVKNLTKKQKHKISKKIRYVLNDTILVDIIENLNSRMVSNVLTNLVQKGLVESAFDSQKNDFVFWIKNNENPKTDSN